MGKKLHLGVYRTGYIANNCLRGAYSYKLVAEIELSY